MDRSSGSPGRWDYIDFELEIREGGPRNYPVSVRSPEGEAQEQMRFPFDKWELQNKLQALEIALLRSGEARRRRIRLPEEQTVQDFGRNLFQALLIGEVRARYEVNLREARRQNKGLRLKLRIHPPELARLPWEFLYDPGRDAYLCLSYKTPLVRYVDLSEAAERLSVTPPLKILGMVASPRDLDPLNVEHEKRLVEEATKDLRADGLIELTWLKGETRRDLQRAMWRGPWHVFHFIGHGGYDFNRDEGLIALANEEGYTRFLRAEDLAQLLKDHDDLRLVLLNSCEGARGSERDAFSSTAATLVRPGIPAVLAMQYEISDEAAIEFSRTFYDAMAEGLPLDAAVAGARTSLKAEVGNTLEWGTPVLYMRSPDGHIFDISTQEVRPPKPPRGETEHEEKEASLRQYRDAAKWAWIDKQPHEREVTELRELANELKLSPSTAADIEREVMGATKEAILERWEKAASEEHRQARPEAEETKAKQDSLEPSTVVVPHLTGQSRPEAKSMLTAAGLKLGRQIKASNEGVPEGRIVKQDPKPGARAKQGSSVNITVSSKSQKNAALSPSSYSLSSQSGQVKQPSPPQTTSSDSSSTHDQNRGEQRRGVSRRGAIVVLLVFLAIGISGSIGWYFVSTSGLVKVPDVRGEYVGDARRMVGSDLVIERGKMVEDPDKDNGIIVSQDPAPNTWVSKDSSVEVDVNSTSR